MNRRVLSLACIAGSAIAAFAPACFAQATFQGLGMALGSDGLTYWIKVSADGQVCSLGGRVAGHDRPYRWSARDGHVPVAACAGDPAGEAIGMSSDGRFIVGRIVVPGGYNAFLWSAAEGLQSLGDLPGGGLYSYAESASDDGRAVCGVANYVDPSSIFIGEAFRWTPETGMVGLGFLKPNHTHSDAVAISADGSTIVGWGGETHVEFMAFKWTQATGMVALGTPPGFDGYSGPWSMTPDGAWTVGNVAIAGVGVVACRWDSLGQISLLGSLPGGPVGGAALAISHDGNTVVGWDHYTEEPALHSVATIWDPIHGVRRLQDVLVNDYGLDVAGWDFQSASGISADGTVIVGIGANPSGEMEFFRVELPKTECKADLNGDGLVDFADYLEFLNLFDAGC